MSQSILFVDDEKQILKSLKRLFALSDYNTFFANDGREALDILDKESIDLVVTDIRMPYMDGYELLSKIKEKHPMVLRLVLSGFTDILKINKALEDNLAKLYIFKPWDNQQLIQIIDKVFQLEKVLKSKKLLNLINNLDDIPTKPNLYSELCNLIKKDVSIRKISDKIEEDQSIAARVLHVANSAFNNGKTGSVKSAIAYLGLSSVKKIVLSNSVFDYAKIKSPIKNLLWDHVKLTNKMVLLIYEKLLNKKIPDSHEAAGLLHDVGKIILLSNFEKEYLESHKLAIKNDDKNIIDTEKSIFGITHQEIGGYLLNWWELPYPIVEAALYHHNPCDEKIINRELVAIVHLANYYSFSVLNHELCKISKLNDSVFDILSVSTKNFEKFFEELKKKKKLI